MIPIHQCFPEVELREYSLQMEDGFISLTFNQWEGNMASSHQVDLSVYHWVYLERRISQEKRRNGIFFFPRSKLSLNQWELDMGSSHQVLYTNLGAVRGQGTAAAKDHG